MFNYIWIDKDVKRNGQGKIWGYCLGTVFGMEQKHEKPSQNRLNWDLSPECSEDESGLVHAWPECSVPKSIKIKVDKDKKTLFLYICTFCKRRKRLTWIFWTKTDDRDSILHLRSQISLIFTQLAVLVVDQISRQDSSTPISREWTVEGCILTFIIGMSNLLTELILRCYKYSFSFITYCISCQFCINYSYNYAVA